MKTKHVVTAELNFKWLNESDDTLLVAVSESNLLLELEHNFCHQSQRYFYSYCVRSSIFQEIEGGGKYSYQQRMPVIG